MAGFDPNFWQNYGFNDLEEQGPATTQPLSQQPKQTLFQRSNPSASHYALGAPPSTTSTSSEANIHSIPSAAPSSMSSPELQYPFGSQLQDFSSSTNTAYLSSADQSAFGAEPFGTDFADWQHPSAGEKQSTVGEWHGFFQPSSSAQSHGLFPEFSLPSNVSYLDPSPFKRPQARASSNSSTHSSPADASPTFQHALWQSSISNQTSARRGSYSRPAMQQPSHAVPQSPQQATTQASGWPSTGATVQSQNYALPEKQIFSSPTSVQDARFQNSPQNQPSQFFHQTSGNFVAPLESSCRFSSTPKLSLLSLL